MHVTLCDFKYLQNEWLNHYRIEFKESVRSLLSTFVRELDCMQYALRSSREQAEDRATALAAAEQRDQELASLAALRLEREKVQRQRLSTLSRNELQVLLASRLC